MAATWPQVQCAHDIELDPNRVYKEWAQITGLHQVVVEDRSLILFNNGICREDGTTHQEALAFITALAVNGIRPRKSAGKKKGGPEGAT